MLGFEGFFCDSLGSEGLFGDSLGRAGAADDFGLGRCGLIFGRVYLKPALLISDAAYDLGFGLFAFAPQASALLSPLCSLAMLRTI